MFNALLNPATLQKIPVQLQQIILPPLKTSLAESLHVVFLVAMGVAILGAIVSLVMGNVKVDFKQGQRPRIVEESAK